VAVAIEGAMILREYKGPYTNQIIYKQRCDNCGYFAPKPPVSVSCLPYGTVMYGGDHRESFICPFCGNRQAVRIQGG
jgi:predicted RNA-binding Zn-ribbon protein involved in translation (DUF1610 family)